MTARRAIVTLGGVAVLAMIAGVAVGLLWPDHPGDTSAEAGFSRDMSAHHAQAVEMAELIRPRTEDPELRLLATDIALTQQAQIGRVSGWLDAWNLSPTSPEPPMTWMGMGGMAMPGMASRADVNALGELPVADAEEAFLRLMIRHHTGGVAMAQAILERSGEPDVRRLAEAIVTGQRAETEAMQALLEARGLEREPLPDTMR